MISVSRIGILSTVATVLAIAQQSIEDPKFAGYAAFGAPGSVTEAHGSWIVPSLTCDGQEVYRTYIWVGIDLVSTVEQIGIVALCLTGTTVPQYSAFYEFYPNPPVEISSMTIRAGDKIDADVRFSGKRFTLTLTDGRQSSGHILSPGGFSAERSSAECVVEMPDGSVPIPDFGTMFFGQDQTGVANTCFATIGKQTRAIGAFTNSPNSVTKITLGANNKYSRAVPSLLSADLSTFSVTSCSLPPSGIVGWWPADGDTNDIIGGNNGGFLGTYADGEVVKAFSLSGGAYVDIGAPANLNISGPITVAAWVNASVAGDDVFHTIFSQMSSSNSLGEIELRINGSSNGNFIPGTFGFRRRPVNGSADTEGISTTQTVPTGTWHHVAAVYDGTNYLIYFDGKPDLGSFIGGGDTEPTGPDFKIGQDNSLVQPFDGLIDEVQIFNRALSASEIGAIYNAGQAGTCHLGR